MGQSLYLLGWRGSGQREVTLEAFLRGCLLRSNVSLSLFVFCFVWFWGLCLGSLVFVSKLQQGCSFPMVVVLLHLNGCASCYCVIILDVVILYFCLLVAWFDVCCCCSCFGCLLSLFNPLCFCRSFVCCQGLCLKERWVYAICLLFPSCDGIFSRCAYFPRQEATSWASALEVAFAKSVYFQSPVLEMGPNVEKRKCMQTDFAGHLQNKLDLCLGAAVPGKRLNGLRTICAVAVALAVASFQRWALIVCPCRSCQDLTEPIQQKSRNSRFW